MDEIEKNNTELEKNEDNNTNQENKKDVQVIENKNNTILALTIVIILLSIAIIVFGALFISKNSLANTYGNTIESSYKKTFYELLDNVNDIDLNLSKVEVSANPALQQKYLQLVSDNCKYAQNNFGTLPVGINTVNEGVRFINQMDGYCSSLVANNEALNEDEKDKITELRVIVVELKTSLNSIVNKLLAGYSILENSNFDEEGLSGFSSNFQGLSADTISYPSMIFDGPFSDSLYNKQIKGLSTNEVSREEATEVVQTAFAEYEDVEINFANETNGNFATYDFEVVADERLFFVQVTKRDGFLLTLSSYGRQSETIINDVAQCEDIAEDFASSLALNDMQSVWSEDLQGICYINLAPIVNNIIYYPDLIKVKIEMSSGNIIGWEAQNYAYNHTTRNNATANLGATEARDTLDIVLNINSQKLCIMPLEYGGETLAYEFECEYYGEQYYIFINANSGKEERVLKVVATNEGQLTE